MYRLVVADDEYIVVEGIKAILKRLDADCEVVGHAYNGIEAVEVIRQTRPDLVITDIRMPGLDGLSVIESCRDFLPEATYLVISGYREFEYARKALALGVTGYIDKPVTMHKINEVLQSLGEKNKKSNHARDRISRQMDRVIDLLLKENLDGLKVAVTDILALLKQSFPEMDTYRMEVFKLLAMVTEVYNDQNQSRNNRLRVSWQEAQQWRQYQDAENCVSRLTEQMTENLCGKKVGSRHRIIKQMIQYIEERYGENIGLNEFALQVNMNPAYLSVLFREEVGVSYVKYLTDYRMRKAKDFLDQGKKVVEVSEQVGYENYRYFCEIFKKREGQTPNEYKGRIRKQDRVVENI